jgi:hypothetical protein
MFPIASLAHYLESSLDLLCFPYLILILEEVGPQLHRGTICSFSVRKVNALLSPQSNDPLTKENQYLDGDGFSIG